MSATKSNTSTRQGKYCLASRHQNQTYYRKKAKLRHKLAISCRWMNMVPSL